MKNILKKFRFELVIISLIVLLIAFYLISRSSLTNYEFSKKYISSDLLSINTSTFIVLFLLVLVEIGFIIFKLQGKMLKRKNVIFVQTMTITFMFFFFAFQTCVFKESAISVNCDIVGNSMDPTYVDGDTVNLKFTKNVEFQDVIIFKVDSENFVVDQTYEKYLIKRVLGLPGDKVVWANKSLYVNDKYVRETYLTSDFLSNAYITMNFDSQFFYKENGEIKYSDTVPNGYVFVMGDNRKMVGNSNASLDSREIGLVPISSILGVI